MRKKTISKKDRTDTFGQTTTTTRWNKEKRIYGSIAWWIIFFFYDSLVRRVWIDKNKRPIVRVTGSHKHSCTFGAVSIEGKQIFRQYDVFNGDTFLEFLKKIHARFPKCYLFMDKASPHYKSKKVLKYFEENKILLSQYIFQQRPLSLWSWKRYGI